MRLFNYLVKNLDYFIFDSFKIDTASLGLYRIFYCLTTFLVYGVPNFTWIDDNLNYLFFPPQISIANLFPGFPDKMIFTGLSMLIVVLYFTLLFGWYTKCVSILLFICLLFCYSFSYSFGKIDHTILWLIIPLIMAYSGWGNAFSLDAYQNNKSEENAWPLRVFALLLGFAMFTASIPKIWGGWLSLDSLATKSHFFVNYFNWREAPLLSDVVLNIKSSLFWKMLDYLTVVFEFSFLIAIIHPLTFRLFIIGAVIFHIAVFFIFNITFTTNLLTYLLYVNWSIFTPLIRSNSFKIIIQKIFQFKYLALIVCCVLIYGINALIFDFDFIFPSLTNLLLINLSAELVRDFNVLLLFTTALIIIILSIASYYKNRQNFLLKVKANS